MRIFRVVTMFMLISIVIGSVGCTQVSRDYSNTYNVETDYPYQFHENGGIRTAITDEGYYFLHGHYIYFADKSSMQPVLLDSRPDNECLQESVANKINNCYAYVNNEEPYGFIAYFGGKLYTTEISPVVGKDKETVMKTKLLEIAKDGSKRTVRMVFDSPPQAIAIHRGFLYYASRDYNKSSKLKYHILKVDMSKWKKPTIVYEGHLEDGYVMQLYPYGKYLYFLESARDMYRTMRYDTQDGSLKRMFSDSNQENAAIGGVRNDSIFFTLFYGDPDDKKSWVLHSSDLNGEHIVDLPINRDFLSNVYVDYQYIYARPVSFYLKTDKYKHIPDQMVVYNSDFRSLEQVDMSFLPLEHSLITGDERYMFMRYMEDGKLILDYLDKRNFGKGNVGFSRLIEIPYQ